jgi:D-erythrulose 4-kinase
VTAVFNDPAGFVDDAMRGFTRLHASLVEPVYGGVVRSTESPDGKVAVVIGGGSGHYPAFAGWVGPGLADGAVVGNVFTSPSTQQIYSVAKAAERGGGVLFGYGNYAGDVLNFDLAQSRLRAEGIRTETVAVTDDVMSAPQTSYLQRRGVAGNLVVFKIAGTAAEAGYDLDAVLAVTRRANRRTVSFGVAFAGCTLPGAGEPLFTVPPGQMGVGLGVHGEPGVCEEPVRTAAGLAAMLVDRLLQERPPDARRIAVLVNGLGGTKYEELFVLWNELAPLLHDAGLEIVAPEVGELITSLDMAGCSLTVTWLDDELETLWTAPAETAAFRRGAPRTTTRRRTRIRSAAAAIAYPAASADSTAAAAGLLPVLDAIARELRDREEELGKLDAVAGDGDHGRGMTAGAEAGLAAARTAVAAGAGIATTLAVAGDAWADKSGGTSGVLWGTGLRAAAAELSDVAAPDAHAAVAAMHAARDHVVAFGKARRGDKTLLDALLPFADALTRNVECGTPLGPAWTAAAHVADEEARATAALTPRVGRARVTADRSVGHPDPGAVSFALVMQVIGRSLS